VVQGALIALGSKSANCGIDRFWHYLTVGAYRLARQLCGGTSAVTAWQPARGKMTQSGPRQLTPFQAVEASAFRCRSRSERVYVIEDTDLAQNDFAYDVSRLDMLRENSSHAGASRWKLLCEFLIIQFYPHDKRG